MAAKKDAPKFCGQAKGPGWYIVWTHVGTEHTVVMADRSGKRKKTLSASEARRAYSEFIEKHVAPKKR